MPIIKLNAIDSTNSYLKDLCGKKKLEDLTVVMAKHQSRGRGQMGTTWDVEDGKNLTCSVFKRFTNYSIEQSFFISIVTSLAIVKTLKTLNIRKLKVKWPNDILSEKKKICGILIENVIKNNQIEASIIGIGLNVNQTYFKKLPQASSLKNITGSLFDIEEILDLLIKHLEFYFKQLENNKHEDLKKNYEALLFRMNMPSTFTSKKEELFPGFIKGIDDSGNLIVLHEDDILKSYELKEIQLLF